MAILPHDSEAMLHCAGGRAYSYFWELTDQREISQRGDDGGDAIGSVVLGGGGFQMGDNRGFGDAEDLRDFPRGLACGGPLQNFPLALGEKTRLRKLLR